MVNEHLNSLQVEAILNQNKSRFTNWLNETGAQQTLDIPEDIAQVLIPRRILELAQDPAHVRLSYLPNSGPFRHSSSVAFMIHETMPHQITDQGVFDKWMSERKPGAFLPYSPHEAPEGADYMHLNKSSLVQSGRLSLKDRWILEYLADVKVDFPKAVKTRIYWDREEMQGLGIGTSFYERLEFALRELGFQYLVGDIASRNVGFFAKTRVPLESLSSSQQMEIPPSELRSSPTLVKVL